MRNIETFDTFFNLSSNCTVHNFSDPCVLGDILILQVGDVVPADCRILDSTEFSVDNSGITGESEPIELDPTATHEKQLFMFFGFLGHLKNIKNIKKNKKG